MYSRYKTIQNVFFLALFFGKEIKIGPLDSYYERTAFAGSEKSREKKTTKNLSPRSQRGSPSMDGFFLYSSGRELCVALKSGTSHSWNLI